MNAAIYSQQVKAASEKAAIYSPSNECNNIFTAKEYNNIFTSR